MPSKYWIKLHQEILEDPKMGRLPDNLWRRTIELFLLAGELGSDLKEDDRGHLPVTWEIAWRLRQPEERLEAELHQLAEIGILTKTETGWLVTNFVKRQQPVGDAERMKQFRERKRDKARRESVTGNKDVVTRSVTGRNAELELEIEIESDKEHGADAPPPSVEVKAAKPRKKKEDSIEVHPAIKTYQNIARRLPDKAIWPEIEKVVDTSPESLDRWGEIITAYIGCGWNKLNVSTMLKFYKENRIPSTDQPKSARNGANQNGHKSNKPLADHRPAFERDGSKTPEQIKAMLKSINAH